MSVLSNVGTKIMLLFWSVESVIEMAYTTKQQPIPIPGLSESVENEEKSRAVEFDVYDEEARKYRQYVARQKALHELEKRKLLALTSGHRVSFFR